MGYFADILGTLRTAFRVGKATLDSSGLTAARTLTLPDASGTIVVGTQSAYATIPGTLAAFVGDLRWYPPRNITLSSVRVDMGVAPSVSAIFNVRKNGTALFSSGKPTVASSQHSSGAVTLSASLTTSDYLTVDVETPSGADAVIRIDYS